MAQSNKDIQYKFTFIFLVEYPVHNLQTNSTQTDLRDTIFQEDMQKRHLSLCCMSRVTLVTDTQTLNRRFLQKQAFSPTTRASFLTKTNSNNGIVYLKIGVQLLGRASRKFMRWNFTKTINQSFQPHSLLFSVYSDIHITYLFTQYKHLQGQRTEKSYTDYPLKNRRCSWV